MPTEAVRLSPDDLSEIVDVAHDYLRGLVSEEEIRSWESAREFAQALVQLSGTCVVGASCAQHEGAVHGQEAEELRAGVEQILHNTADVNDDEEEATLVLSGMRRSLIFLLDRVDARDSLAFREAADPPDESAASPA